MLRRWALLFSINELIREMISSLLVLSKMLLMLPLCLKVFRITSIAANIVLNALLDLGQVFVLFGSGAVHSFFRFGHTVGSVPYYLSLLRIASTCWFQGLKGWGVFPLVFL